MCRMSSVLEEKTGRFVAESEMGARCVKDARRVIGAEEAAFADAWMTSGILGCRDLGGGDASRR